MKPARKPNPALMKPVQPDEVLAPIVGSLDHETTAFGWIRGDGLSLGFSQHFLKILEHLARADIIAVHIGLSDGSPAGIKNH